MDEYRMPMNEERGGGQFPPDCQPAHFSMEELQDFANMFGMEQLPLLEGYEDIEIYDLRPLEPLFMDPEIQSIMTESSAMAQHEMPHMAEGGHLMLEEAKELGENGDSELAIVPNTLIELFDEWTGTTDNINPYTGFKEYAGWLKKTIRIAAPIVGHIFGGPIGAALASGIATKATGGSWGSALGSAALSAAGSHFLGGGGGGGGFGNWFGGQGGNAANEGVKQIAAENVGKELTNRAVQQTAKNPGFLDKLSEFSKSDLGSLLKKGVSGSLLYAGGKQEEEDARRANEEARNRYKSDIAEARKSFGIDAKLPPLMGHNPIGNNRAPTPEQIYYGETPLSNQSILRGYKQGGLIKGPGTPTSDSIKREMKEGGFIIENKSLRNLGSGSAAAGAQRLDQALKNTPSIPTSTPYMPVMVSNDEYEIPADKVTGIGGGNNQLGAARINILRKFADKKKPKHATGYLSALQTMSRR